MLSECSRTTPERNMSRYNNLSCKAKNISFCWNTHVWMVLLNLMSGTWWCWRQDEASIYPLYHTIDVWRMDVTEMFPEAQCDCGGLGYPQMNLLLVQLCSLTGNSMKTSGSSISLVCRPLCSWEPSKLWKSFYPLLQICTSPNFYCRCPQIVPWIWTTSNQFTLPGEGQRSSSRNIKKITGDT